MAKFNISAKQLMIDKANSTMVVIIVIASFVVVFSLVASRVLLDQRAYQSRVIAQKEKAKKQLDDNAQSVDRLTASYQNFITAPQNALGGDPKGTGEKDGDNAQVTLDALPSKYDYPALTTSIEKLVTSKNMTIESFTGVDDEVTQSQAEPNPVPAPIEMPFEVTVKGPYDGMKEVVTLFERSIRPFQVSVITFTGGDRDMNMTITGKSYYQPEKSLNIRTEVVPR